MSRENVYWIRDKMEGCIENGWKEERKNAFEKKNYCANWDDSKWSGNRVYKSVFVHVPRTGGSSIGKSLKEYSVFPDHHLAKDIKLKQLYKDFFFYTILRNPYERIVSVYEYVFRDEAMGYIRKLLAFYQAVQDSPDFLNYRNDQVRLGPGPPVTSKAELLERVEKNTLWLSGEEIAQLPIPTKEDFSFERFVNIITEEVWDIMWEPQTSYIFDDNDKLIVDYMGKTETLQQDLDNIVEEINKRNTTNSIKEKIKVSHENFTISPPLYSMSVDHHHYRSYYTDEIRKKVEKYYEKDIAYLKILF
tara:strand:- start:50 stop:961 length:912 start_codon:yes stop_codon:yes gene_type:complete